MHDHAPATQSLCTRTIIPTLSPLRKLSGPLDNSQQQGIFRLLLKALLFHIQKSAANRAVQSKFNHPVVPVFDDFPAGHGSSPVCHTGRGEKTWVITVKCRLSCLSIRSHCCRPSCHLLFHSPRTKPISSVSQPQVTPSFRLLKTFVLQSRLSYPSLFIVIKIIIHLSI
jgi:hypothetical protein